VKKPYHHGDLREGLLRAAEAILDRDGIGALSLRAVAREAGVTHAAPRHHFGDMTGLLTALAASGYVRLREGSLAEAVAVGADPVSRLIASGRGYLGFARQHPGLLQLMLRSERLDWSQPALSDAAAAAFALLTASGAPNDGHGKASPFEGLVLAIERLALVHGLATLLVDGRVEAMARKAGQPDVEAIVDAVLSRIAVEKTSRDAGSHS
jgi:AcrR family transcriptional regulator